MSLPIDIPRRATRSSVTSLSGSASSASTSATTPSSSLGLYIPVHKRTPSSESSRTSHVHPRIYSVDFLFSLRPTADESVTDKLRTSCPEVVMSRRIRKNLEFHERQRHHYDLLTPQEGLNQERQRIDVGIHRVPALLSQKQSHVPSVTLSSQSPGKGRVLPRRNSRSAIRPAERRRQAWQPIHVSANGTRGLEMSVA